MALVCLDRVLSPATRSPWVPLQGGTVIGKTPEEREKLHLGFYTQNFCRVVEEIPARTGKMGHFYLGFYTLNFFSAKNKTTIFR